MLKNEFLPECGVKFYMSSNNSEETLLHDICESMGHEAKVEACTRISELKNYETLYGIGGAKISSDTLFKVFFGLSGCCFVG